MRQAGVSEAPKIVGVRVAWDEVPEDASGGATPIAARGAATPAATAPTPLVSRQPAPGPLAAGVADRYAKALTLDPAPVAPPPPPAPRRSRAAMRDRALRPNTSANNRRPERARSRTATAAPVRELRTLAPALDAESDPAPDRERRSTASARSSSRPTTHDPQSRRAAVAPPPAGAPESASLSRRWGASARPTAGVRDDPVGGIAGRRTVTIRGRGAERDLGWSPYHSRRRPPVLAHERSGFRPDRAAMWAVFLGLLLVLVAATSSHAAVLTHVFH
jgi:hypothetical protein